VEAYVDPRRLDQLLGNLVSNAVRHASSRVEVVVSSDGDAAALIVADDGDGFTEAVLPRAFDRFARAGGGPATEVRTGLGLSIVRAIVDAHAGQVSARNGEPLGGGVVEVRLPLKPSSTGSGEQ